MENSYLEQLLDEVEKREGGLILSRNGMPAAVVLAVEKYNQMISDLNFEHGDLIAQESKKPFIEEMVIEGQLETGDYVSNNNKNILVTGGAGYIGAHAVRELLKAGYNVTIYDNLSTGKQENLQSGAAFVEGDLSDRNLLRDVFAGGNFYAVLHFAASLEVEESVREPEKYLRNNTLNTAVLLSVMAEYNVRRLVFSSTAAVYGDQQHIPISENAKLQPANPYGYSKLLAERIIKYYCHFENFQAVIFRFFNACGCDFDGRIKPTHNTHLIPIIVEVAMNKRPLLKVFGADYPTPDGSCIRDYVHVLDIASAHVLALSHIAKSSPGENYKVYNIGTGTGHSVLEVVKKAAEVLHKTIPIETVERRPGDSAATVADNTKVRTELGIELLYSDLDTIIKTTWNQMK